MTGYVTECYRVLPVVGVLPVSADKEKQNKQFDRFFWISKMTKNVKIPLKPEDVTKEWLKEALENIDMKNVEVIKLELITDAPGDLSSTFKVQNE